MELAQTIADVRRFRLAYLESSRHVSLGLVPTMGALHPGHLSLVRAAQAENELVAVSIFVNPTQFGPNDDLNQYPRTLESDRRLLEEMGVDLLFAPTPESMYPSGFSTVVDIGALGQRLDGASRPGHFAGVATVVAKLLNIFLPDRAYFGQKDAAQVAVIRRLIKDLDFATDVIVCPTVRAADGVALSSRNHYLNSEEREQASVLSRALSLAQQNARAGETAVSVLLASVQAILASEQAFRLDYLTVVDPDTLETLSCLGGTGNLNTDSSIRRPALLALAGWIGTTRLIDNILL